MHRLSSLDSECLHDCNDNDKVHNQNINVSLQQQQQPPMIPTNPSINRLCLLPAYPTFDRLEDSFDYDHLLLSNIAHRNLTTVQRRRRDHFLFHQPFTLIDQSNDPSVQPFFVSLYQRMYKDLTQRFHVDNAIIDDNYQCLHKCIHIMIYERVRHSYYSADIMGRDFQLSNNEYILALEFYLQIDVELFFMKTCSFRDAQPSVYNHHGIFCIDPPQAYYGMTPCRTVTCRFCFPITDIITCARQNQPVVQFSTAQKHRFVNGYQTILNCPIVCSTRNILYVLTCPCGQFDFIGYTSTSLGEQLISHREHTNRMIHEFFLGPDNIKRMRQQSKTSEKMAADTILLYQHFSHCSSAIQIFLDCNPDYWCFVPMHASEIASSSDTHQLDSKLAQTIDLDKCRDQQEHQYISDLPATSSDHYVFTANQRAQQSQIFKNKRHCLAPNYNLDLYNAAIIAVLPDNCSDIFYRTIEALFITHAQTKLNLLGHLDGMNVQDSTIMNCKETGIDINQSDWYQKLVRRPPPPPPPSIISLQAIRKITTHRMNAHYQ